MCPAGCICTIASTIDEPLVYPFRSRSTIKQHFKFFLYSAVCYDISVAFAPQLNPEADELSAKDFLAAFPTKHGCSGQESNVKKGTSISKVKTASLTEKSPRQERRNARERGRKARLNAAFRVLRSIVPHDLDSTQRKLTQVEILRLAKNYICSLTTILQTSNDNVAVSYKQNSGICVGNFLANMNELTTNFSEFVNPDVRSSLENIQASSMASSTAMY